MFLNDLIEHNNEDIAPNMLDPLSLAFVGDAVFDLLVRRHMVFKYGETVGKLNKRKVEIVCCKAQAKGANAILDLLSQNELSVYKRGKNAHTKQFPKNATLTDYRCATGLECLFGYLYLSGNIKRVNWLMNEIYRVLGS